MAGDSRLSTVTALAPNRVWRWTRPVSVTTSPR